MQNGSNSWESFLKEWTNQASDIRTFSRPENDIKDRRRRIHLGAGVHVHQYVSFLAQVKQL
jgi:hypothetical protein